MSWLDQKVQQIVDPIIQDAVDNQILKAIERTLRYHPNRELTKTGFDWALALALVKIWPGLDRRTATKWLKEYIGTQYGTTGYLWTAKAAGEIAAQYALEFGEQR